MSIDCLVRVRVKSNAELRTKHCIKAHGEIYSIIHPFQFCARLDGDKGLCLKSQKDNWQGWLPAKDLVVHDVGIIERSERV